MRRIKTWQNTSLSSALTMVQPPGGQLFNSMVLDLANNSSMTDTKTNTPTEDRVNMATATARITGAKPASTMT